MTYLRIQAAKQLPIVRHMVQRPKRMLTVVSNTEGFHVVDVLPKGATFDTDCYCEDRCWEIPRAGPVRANRGLVVHADNTRPHT
jgi:hypothetical protein